MSNNNTETKYAIIHGMEKKVWMEELNRRLNGGWKIVPGTLNIDYNNGCFVVMERSVQVSQQPSSTSSHTPPVAIYGYHGKLTPDMESILDKMGDRREDGGWDFNGNLGQFANQWCSKFMVYYESKTDSYVVYVTQHSNFNPR